MMPKLILPSVETPALVTRVRNQSRWAARRIVSFLKNPIAYGRRAVEHIAALLSPLLPKSALARFHRRRTFQNVYKNQLWGSDGKSQFFSGVGSHGGPATAYVNDIAPILLDHLGSLGRQATILDLGCGDFSVGSQLLHRLPSLAYLGCDVVPEIIEHNRKKHGAVGVQFKTLDIVSDDLPDGDICLVRQVLQHLSNSDIACVLPKLRKYRYVYITEGQPLVRIGNTNPDKPANSDVRFDWRTGYGRGVELDQPPWNLSIEEVSRVPALEHDKELIVTHRVRFSSHS
jgi:Methyltransferase domain